MIKVNKDSAAQVAVLTSNHRNLLDAAVKRSREKPIEPIPFQAKQKWTSARDALAEAGTLRLYARPNGSREVEYEAELTDILLGDELTTPRANALRENALEETKQESHWGKTLLAARGWRRVAPTALPDFTKVDGGLAVSAGYIRSYCLVHEVAPLPAESATFFPEELDPDQTYAEGASQQVLVNRYERNSKARAACVAHWKCKCFVCDLVFAEAYGERGVGFIHVHHRTPMSTVDKKYVVDPVADLLPVCPNCHAMLHRGEVMAPEDLRRIVQSRKGTGGKG